MSYWDTSTLVKLYEVKLRVRFGRLGAQEFEEVFEGDV